MNLEENRILTGARPTQPDQPFLVVGLGNPGREYRFHRHNVGFMAIDAVSKRMGVALNRVQVKALVATMTRDGKRLILAKPQSFMNLSGQPVRSLMHFYKAPLENILIIHDDLDLPIGTLRIRPGGGSAGHKGLISIIEQLGTDTFPRLRVGIGRPPGRMEGADYVLQDFPIADREIIEQVLERASQAVLTFVNLGIVTAMNQFNVVLSKE